MTITYKEVKKHNGFPKSVFAGIIMDKEEITLLIHDRSKKIGKYKVPVGYSPNETLLSFVRDLSKKENLKFIAVAFSQSKLTKDAASTLWLKENISPFFLKTDDLNKLVKKAKERFDENNSYHAETDEGKVLTPYLVDLKEYEAITPPAKFREILRLSSKLKNKRISYFSATPQGGGVAIMRHALMRFYDLLGLNIKWYVLKDDPDVFFITKNKFHNIFQDVADVKMVLDENDKELFDRWSEKNYQFYKDVIRNSDLMVIDDPQPSGLVPFIRRDFPDKPIIFRLHIHMLSKLADKKGTAQNISWSYLFEKIKSSDLFIAHPIKSFVPKSVNKDKVALMGATTDQYDGLNKHLSEVQQSYYTRILNGILKESGQTPIDVTRPIITQVARFDPSKGIPDALDAFYKLRKKLKTSNGNAPQLVIAGNSSIDDPDGVPVYNYAMKLLGTEKYKDIRKDVKIIRLPHNDFIINTLMRIATIYIQLSHKEGFEDKVTGALMKGKPVVIYDTGGMPLQVRDGRSGFIVKKGDTSSVSEKLYKLLTDENLYNKMKKEALSDINPDMNTQSNALYWLYLFDQILNKGRKSFGFKKLSELVKVQKG